MIQRGALLQGTKVWLSQKATAMSRLRARQHHRCHEHSECDKQCESRKLVRGLEEDELTHGPCRVGQVLDLTDARTGQETVRKGQYKKDSNEPDLDLQYFRPVSQIRERNSTLVDKHEPRHHEHRHGSPDDRAKALCCGAKDRREHGIHIPVSHERSKNHRKKQHAADPHDGGKEMERNGRNPEIVHAYQKRDDRRALTDRGMMTAGGVSDGKRSRGHHSISANAAATMNRSGATTSVPSCSILMQGLQIN